MDPSPFALVVSERSWYLGDFVSALLVGVELSLFLQSAYYLINGPFSRGKKLFFIGYGGILLLLITIAACTNEVLGLLMWINDRDVPGGPEAYLAEQQSGWLNVLGTSAVVTADFMANALWMYRCYIMLSGKMWIVILLPASILLTSTVLSVLATVESALPNAAIFTGRALSFTIPWIALTVTFNVVVTALICGRITMAYVAVKKFGRNEAARERWGIVAILIESALPFSVLGIVVAVIFGKQSQTVSAFADVWGNMVGLSPQLIILRVAMGRAWTKENIESGKTFGSGDRAARVWTQSETRIELSKIGPESSYVDKASGFQVASV